MAQVQGVLSGTIASYRPRPLGNEKYTVGQRQMVLDGVRAKKPYDMIARDLRMNDDEPRPFARGPGVYYYVTGPDTFGSVENFLRENDVTDEVEIEEILAYYDKTNGGQPLSKKPLSTKQVESLHRREKKQWVPPPRPMKHDVVAERAALEALIVEGIKEGKSFFTIVDDANAKMIPADYRTVKRIVDTYDGPVGFLMHAGLAPKQAKEIAAKYAGTD